MAPSLINCTVGVVAAAFVASANAFAPYANNTASMSASSQVDPSGTAVPTAIDSASMLSASTTAFPTFSAPLCQRHR
ncbi:hypothetical protein PG987_003416 [Apiospora arundinis]